jgi:hypothetical protein
LFGASPRYFDLSPFSQNTSESITPGLGMRAGIEREVPVAF